MAESVEVYLTWVKPFSTYPGTKFDASCFQAVTVNTWGLGGGGGLLGIITAMEEKTRDS
jgi:hypothetical protein